MHHIKISNFGPIKECEMDVNQFTVLTGAQASGKSTIAKAIYFFRTIKDDILDLILKNKEQKPLKQILENHLSEKFINLFGELLNDERGIILEYVYREDNVFLSIQSEYALLADNQGNPFYTKDQEQLSVLAYAFNWGIKIQNFFDNIIYYQIKEIPKMLDELFNDNTETIYIPAGRMTVSLLSEQLTPIFFSMDDGQRRTIDYSFWKYFELILKIRPYFEKINLRYKAIGEFYQKIIKAEYKYENLQERLYFDDDNYIALNFASSGQQEAVWILNILNYFSAENKKVFIIVEEPEAHLYPKSQMYMTDVLALFINGGNNSGLITTHSPYILGEVNNLILCGQAENEGIDKNSIREAADINERAWFKKDVLQAFHVIDGKCENALTEEYNLIKNELIEGASEMIDNKSAALIDLFHREDNT